MNRLILVLFTILVVWKACAAAPPSAPDAAVLRRLNVSAESRLGGVLLTFLQQRRNGTRWRPLRNRTGLLLGALQGVSKAPPQDEEEDDYYEDDEEYPDYDLSPESILVYVLELFGTMIGLTWGAVSTLFG